MAGVHLIGDWNLARLLIQAWGSKFQSVLRECIREEAEWLRGEIVQGIIAGAPGGVRFKPLAATTLAFRRYQAIGGIMAKRDARVGKLLSGTQARLSRQAGARQARAIQAGSNKLMQSAKKASDRAVARGRSRLAGQIQRIEASARGQMTKALSRVGTKPLIQTGDLVNSIRVVMNGDEAFVGVLRTARGKDGRKLVNIARIHEFGAGPKAVKMTDKQRRWLMMMLRKSGVGAQSARGGGGVLLIRIPARPFLRPVFRLHYADQTAVSWRFLDRIQSRLPTSG